MIVRLNFQDATVKLSVRHCEEKVVIMTQDTARAKVNLRARVEVVATVYYNNLQVVLKEKRKTKIYQKQAKRVHRLKFEE